MNTKITGAAILVTLMTEFAEKHELSHQHSHEDFEQPMHVSMLGAVSLYGILNNQQIQSQESIWRTF
ncbi:MAG: hypothetical protein IPK57_02505 [Chitinophagaceae bacterium]|nr:hypothetical protein [Chitinophagaceae bacterium]